MNVALPSGLKITSQSRIQINPEFEYEDLLTDQERIIIDEIRKQQTLSYEEVERLLGRSNITALIKSLVGKRAVILFEEVKEKYKPKVLKKVRLTASFLTNDSLVQLTSSLEKHPRQQEIILRYLSHIPVYNNPELNHKGLDKSIFTQDDGISDSAMQTLIRKGVFEQFEIFRFQVRRYSVRTHGRNHPDRVANRSFKADL